MFDPLLSCAAGKDTHTSSLKMAPSTKMGSKKREAFLPSCQEEAKTNHPLKCKGKFRAGIYTIQGEGTYVLAFGWVIYRGRCFIVSDQNFVLAVRWICVKNMHVEM